MDLSNLGAAIRWPFLLLGTIMSFMLNNIVLIGTSVIIIWVAWKFRTYWVEGINDILNYMKGGNKKNGIQTTQVNGTESSSTNSSTGNTASSSTTSSNPDESRR